jgi:hypothetical protein
MTTVPPEQHSPPDRIFSSVVLPMPFWPIRPVLTAPKLKLNEENKLFPSGNS